MKKRVTIAAAALAMGVLPVAPALAAPPEITQQSCEESGGTFARERGVKSCTVVTTEVVLGPVVTLESDHVYVSSGEVWYVGESQRAWTVETTTTQFQKGNGEVTSETTEVVLDSSVVPLSCTRVERPIFTDDVTSTAVDFSECASRDLYLI